MDLRTSDAKVRAAIPDFSSSLSTTNMIRTANRLVDKVVANDSGNLLNSEILVEIETYLAAHLCALADPQYSSKSTEGASGQWQGQFGKGLMATYWGQTAVTLDTTGFLASINEGRKSAGMTWLGLPPSEQTDYGDRD